MRSFLATSAGVIALVASAGAIAQPAPPATGSSTALPPPSSLPPPPPPPTGPPAPPGLTALPPPVQASASAPKPKATTTAPPTAPFAPPQQTSAPPPGYVPAYPSAPYGYDPYAGYPPGYSPYSYYYYPTQVDYGPPPPPKRRVSTLMMGLGITSTSVGIVTLLIGSVLLSSSKNKVDIYCDGSPPLLCAHKDNPTEKGAGVVLMVGGGVLAAVGIPLWIVGARKVPIEKNEQPAPPKASLRVGPGTLRLDGAF